MTSLIADRRAKALFLEYLTDDEKRCVARGYLPLKTVHSYGDVIEVRCVDLKGLRHGHRVSVLDEGRRRTPDYVAHLWSCQVGPNGIYGFRRYNYWLTLNTYDYWQGSRYSYPRWDFALAVKLFFWRDNMPVQACFSDHRKPPSHISVNVFKQLAREAAERQHRRRWKSLYG